LRVRAIPHEILLHLAHPDHGVVEHLLEQPALLRVRELFVAVLRATVDLANVQLSVILEPLQFVALVGSLHERWRTLFSLRLSCRG